MSKQFYYPVFIKWRDSNMELGQSTVGDNLPVCEIQTIGYLLNLQDYEAGDDPQIARELVYVDSNPEVRGRIVIPSENILEITHLEFTEKEVNRNKINKG